MIDLIFWYIGAIVCGVGSIAATLALLWWLLETIMRHLGVTKTFLSALYEIRKAQRDKGAG